VAEKKTFVDSESAAYSVNGESLLIYDFNATGHCPSWLSIVTEAFLGRCRNIIVACQRDARSMDGWQKRIHENADAIIPIADRPLQSHFTDALRLADSVGAEAIFFPNLDSILYDLGSQIGENGLALADVSGHQRIAGIWLRPHVYDVEPSAFERLRAKLNRSTAGKFQRRLLRTKWNNLRALKFLADSNRLGKMTYFFTDPGEIQKSNTLLNGVKRRVICDPWMATSALDRSSARTQLNLPENKVIILHAGTSRREKGLKDLCLAMGRLSPIQTQELLLYRIGQVDPADRPWLQGLIKNKLACSVERYVSEDELLAAYAACDWVVLPYRDQAESSGIMVHAAAHQRPVLVSDFGLIGDWTRQFGLGLTFKHKNVLDLSLKLGELTKTEEGIFPGLNKFAQLHTTASFQSTIIEDWWQAMD